MRDKKSVEAMRSRWRQIGAWLEDACPYAEFDQKHLNAHTPEQTYWHLGYHAALGDALRVLENQESDGPEGFGK